MDDYFGNFNGGGSGEDAFFYSSSSNPTNNATTTVSSEVSESYIDPLTDNQEIVLSVLLIVSGLCSVLGSSTIIYKVSTNLKKSSTPYDRLMLGLSSCDIVASLSWILTPFLEPSGTSVWAIGSTTSCTILGTLSQFAFSAIWYNCMLSFYYLLTVRFHVKRHDFARKYEKSFHIGTLLYFTGTAIAGAIMGVYSEVDIGMGCWVNDYPTGCEVDDTCISEELGWLFGAGPTSITFLTLIVNNIVIYIHVRKSLKSNGSGTEEDDEKPGNLSSMKPSSIRTSVTTAASSAGTSSSSLSTLPSTRRMMMASSKSKFSTSTSSINTSVRSIVSTSSTRTTASQYKRTQQHQRHISEVATQGFLYVGTFLLAYLPAIILRVLEAYGSTPVSIQNLYPLLVLQSILLPLQGFFNMFVYNRPNFIRLKMAYPDSTLTWIVSHACFDKNIPKLIEASKISQSRKISSTKFPKSKSNNNTSSGKMFSSALEILPEEDEYDDYDDEDYSNEDFEVLNHAGISNDSNEKDHDFVEEQYYMQERRDKSLMDPQHIEVNVHQDEVCSITDQMTEGDEDEQNEEGKAADEHQQSSSIGMRSDRGTCQTISKDTYYTSSDEDDDDDDDDLDIESEYSNPASREGSFSLEQACRQARMRQQQRQEHVAHGQNIHGGGSGGRSGGSGRISFDGSFHYNPPPSSH